MTCVQRHITDDGVMTEHQRQFERWDDFVHEKLHIFLEYLVSTLTDNNTWSLDIKNVIYMTVIVSVNLIELNILGGYSCKLLLSLNLQLSKMPYVNKWLLKIHQFSSWSFKANPLKNN